MCCKQTETTVQCTLKRVLKLSFSAFEWLKLMVAVKNLILSEIFTDLIIIFLTFSRFGKMGANFKTFSRIQDTYTNPILQLRKVKHTPIRGLQMLLMGEVSVSSASHILESFGIFGVR